MSSKEKNKKKEEKSIKDKNKKDEKSIKDKKKKEEFVVIIDKDILEKIENLKVEIVFINNSLLKDEKIINAMIYQYKILEYKCCNTKCSISNEWLSNPINLSLKCFPKTPNNDRKYDTTNYPSKRIKAFRL